MHVTSAPLLSESSNFPPPPLRCCHPALPSPPALSSFCSAAGESSPGRPPGSPGGGPQKDLQGRPEPRVYDVSGRVGGQERACRGRLGCYRGTLYHRPAGCDILGVVDWRHPGTCVRGRGVARRYSHWRSAGDHRECPRLYSISFALSGPLSFLSVCATRVVMCEARVRSVALFSRAHADRGHAKFTSGCRGQRLSQRPH